MGALRVAVYVPCFNGAAWIEECVAALLGQTRPADEVAVVDDGSTDASADIVRRFGERVRLIQHEGNRGLAVARNTALAALECDVLASVDADVRATPDWLENMLAGFDSPSVGAVGGKLIEAHQERIADRWRATHMAQHAGDFPLRSAPTLAGATMAVRRDVVRDMGGYDETLRTNYEDADLRVRLIERGYRCAYTPEAQAYHLRTDTPKTVLRTYWGWLRPPAERDGVFATAEGLERRRRDVWERTIRALWLDVSEGREELAYLSLLMGVAYPVADGEYATRFNPSLSALARGWLNAVPAALAEHSAYLASHVSDDMTQVAWWDSSSNSAGRLEGFAPRDALASVPSAWWRRIERSRAALARWEGWRQSEPIHGTSAPADDGTLAVIEHGRAGDRIPLRVTREASAAPTPFEIAAHRIGWLAPSPLQQSLLHSGTLAAGEPAALDAVPPWRPESIDPLTATDEVTRAEALLSAGQVVAAREAAVNALLVVRRSYAAGESERRAALALTWPSVSDAHSPEGIVREARTLVEDWLFTWHGDGLSDAARARWRALREAAA